MRLLPIILFTFFSSSVTCIPSTQQENQEFAEYNKNKAIEKLEECNKIVENCIAEMFAYRNYYDKKDELEMAEMACRLSSENAKKIIDKLKKCN